jgi:hypothetical protein
MKPSNKVVLSVSLLAMMLLTSMSLAIPVFAGNANQIVGQNPDFVLNILGKKDGWKPNGSFDNFDRHTIFVPEDTTGSSPGTYGGTSFADSILIWMQSGLEFGVLDGNACDDGNASIQVETGRYRVFVSVHGKPSNENKGENRLADLKGWYYDDEGELLGVYLYELGTAKILSRGKGSPVPVEVTDLFEVEYAVVYDMLVHMYMDAGMTEAEAQAAATELLESYGYEPDDMIWIFDFLEMLSDVFNDPDYYFWQLTNSGLKHIQVRFYKA